MLETYSSVKFIMADKALGIKPILKQFVKILIVLFSILQEVNYENQIGSNEDDTQALMKSLYFNNINMLNLKQILVYIAIVMCLFYTLKGTPCEPIEVSLQANLNKESQVLTIAYNIENRNNESIFIPISDWYIVGFQKDIGVYSSQYYYVNFIHNPCVSWLEEGMLDYNAKYIPKILKIAPYTKLTLKVKVNKVDTINLCGNQLNSDIAFANEATIQVLKDLFYKIDFGEIIVTPDYTTNIFELTFDSYNRCMMFADHSNIKVDDTFLKCLKMAFLGKLNFQGNLKVE